MYQKVLKNFFYSTKLSSMGPTSFLGYVNFGINFRANWLKKGLSKDKDDKLEAATSKAASKKLKTPKILGNKIGKMAEKTSKGYCITTISYTYQRSFA